MSEITSVGIIGAGALGLLYIEPIADLLKEEAYFMAGNSRCDTINGTVYTINENECSFSAQNPIESDIQPDLIIVAVKNYHMKEIAPLLLASAGSETIILSVLNGISSEGEIEKLCPESTVLYTAALGMDAVKEGNALNYTGRGKLVIGSRTNDPVPALEKVCSFLKRCGLDYTVPEDIHKELWYKWMINIGVNQVSAVTGASYGSFQKDPELKKLMDRAMMETIVVARNSAVDLDNSDLKRWYPILDSLGPEGKTSMLQDMEAGRQTEVESFAGELIRRAETLGLDVPVNQTLYTIIKTKESLN